MSVGRAVSRPLTESKMSHLESKSVGSGVGGSAKSRVGGYGVSSRVHLQANSNNCMETVYPGG